MEFSKKLTIFAGILAEFLWYLSKSSANRVDLSINICLPQEDYTEHGTSVYFKIRDAALWSLEAACCEYSNLQQGHRIIQPNTLFIYLYPILFLKLVSQFM